MKPLKPLILFLYGLLLIAYSPLYAQTKTKEDVIVKLNGEELKGKVLAVDDNSIKFVYTGETLEYTFKKSDLEKIVFSSGRVEAINNATAAATPSTAPTANKSPADHKNKVAILPFSYITDGQPGGDEMTIKVQNECFALLNNHAGGLSILDNHTTNALLVKAGVNIKNLEGYTMQELCDILGVEYVISGMVTVDKTNQTSYNSNVQNSSTDRKSTNKKTSSSTYGSSYSTNTQNYATTLLLNIYNDKNETIYTQDRKSFWHEQDAYKSTLEYLVKRSPLYKK